MAKRLTWIITSITAFFLAALLILTGTTMLKANAQEEPEPELPASGWYVVGNGAGYLKDCSWTEFKAAYRVTEKTEEQPDDYTGEFTLPQMLLYPGDAFKFVYTDGTKANPDATGWTTDVVAQFNNILDNSELAFVDGGLGNIEAIKEGYYTFKLYVDQDSDTKEVTIGLEYVRSDEKVPDITLYDMYVVGTIANETTCNWPGVLEEQGKTVADNCIKMTYVAATDKWIARVTLVAQDEFKVYNLVTDAYYPSGVEDNYTGYTGDYVIEWGTSAPDILVIPASEYPLS